jgi:hypothetical protein
MNRPGKKKIPYCPSHQRQLKSRVGEHFSQLHNFGFNLKPHRNPFQQPEDLDGLLREGIPGAFLVELGGGGGEKGADLKLYVQILFILQKK